jgi:sec-independent protein translocase protein TatA
MGEMSIWHWLLVIFIALILFAPSKLAGLGKGLAEGIRSFKTALNEGAEKKEEKTEEKKS